MGSPVLFAGPAVALVIVLTYVIALRSRHHYTSVLTCPMCGRTFDYQWVPLASFSALRLGRNRYLRCPLCNDWSTFDILSTRVETPGAAERLVPKRAAEPLDR